MITESLHGNGLSKSAISPAWLHVKRKSRSTLPNWLFHNIAILSNDYQLINGAVFRLTVWVWNVALIGPLAVQEKSHSFSPEKQIFSYNVSNFQERPTMSSNYQWQIIYLPSPYFQCTYIFYDKVLYCAKSSDSREVRLGSVYLIIMPRVV